MMPEESGLCAVLEFVGVFVVSGRFRYGMVLLFSTCLDRLDSLALLKS